jgi:predicted DNA binding CopG/RHH family protein
MFLLVFQRVSGKTRNFRTLCKNAPREPYRIRPTGFFCIVPAGLYRFSPTNPYRIRPTIKFRTKKAPGTIRNEAHYNDSQNKHNIKISNTTTVTTKNYVTIPEQYNELHLNRYKGIQTMAQNSPKTTVITLRLDTKLLEAIRTEANKEELPMSYIIRRAIKAGLNIPTKPMPKSTEVEMPDWE